MLNKYAIELARKNKLVKLLFVRRLLCFSPSQKMLHTHRIILLFSWLYYRFQFIMWIGRIWKVVGHSWYRNRKFIFVRWNFFWECSYLITIIAVFSWFIYYFHHWIDEIGLCRATYAWNYINQVENEMKRKKQKGFFLFASVSEF